MSKFILMVDGFNAWLTACATVWLEDGVWYFQYFKAYIEHPDAFPLDPVNLPLAFTEYAVGDVKHGLKGVVSELYCGAWGSQVLTQSGVEQGEQIPESIGTGIGVLSVVFAERPVTGLRQSCKLSDLPEVIEAIKLVGQGGMLNTRQSLLLRTGSGFPGVHPKVVVEDGGKAYLAKIYMRGESGLSQFNGEAYHMAALNCLVRTANIKPISVGENFAILVERFDMTGIDPSAHVVSVTSMFPDLKADALYDEAVKVAWQLQCPITDIHELFIRRVYDKLIGNSEGITHTGFMHKLKSKCWRVAPACSVYSREQRDLRVTDKEVEDLLSKAHLYGMDAEYGFRLVNTVLRLHRAD